MSTIGISIFYVIRAGVGEQAFGHVIGEPIDELGLLDTKMVKVVKVGIGGRKGEAWSRRSVQVFVDTFTGETIVLDVEAWDTTDKVKYRIRDKETLVLIINMIGEPTPPRCSSASRPWTAAST